MAYDISRLQSNDPTYAPGMVRVRDTFYWRPSPTYTKLGFPKKNIRLTQPDMAAECRRLTRDMLERFNGPDLRKPLITWSWLIARYTMDECSPYQEVKANTRETYRKELHLWESMIGGQLVADADFPDMKMWQRELGAVSPSHAQRHFGRLRALVGYGVMIRVDGIREVKAVLSEIRIRGGKPRQSAPVEAEIMAIVRAADEAGEHTWATGLLCQWWLTLRAVDVRGQVVGRQWRDGITWDMFDRDMTVLRKVPSKTERYMPEALEFDLTLIPELRARLMALPRGVGPVFTTDSGQPFTANRWSYLFRKFRGAAGVRDDLWMMDTRAGAINDARRSGASPYDLRAQANHASLTTTDRYVRERSDTANKVIRMRTRA